MPKAVKCVIKHCFVVENYDFLLCSYSVVNNQSRRVIEKCDFEYFTEKSRKAINGEVRISKYYLLNNKINKELRR